MPEYGLTDAGFVLKPTLTILEEMRNEYREEFGDLDVDGDTPDGVTLAIVAERAGECWELGEAVYNSQWRDSANGRALDNVCLLTGTFRPASSFTTVRLTLTGVPGTPVPREHRAGKSGADDEFQTLGSATIAPVPAWIVSNAYAEGSRVTNGGRVFICTQAGTSAGAGGPSTTGDDITDNTAHWRYLGDGTGCVDTLARATKLGPVVASAGTITEIVTPRAGWQGVYNIDDATVGQLEAKDGDLRLLAEEELQNAGTSPLNAIRARMRRVKGVTHCSVFHNTGNVVDADGVPPGHVEVLVAGGDDQAIRDALLDSVAGGIGTHGTTSGTATDDEGTQHTIKFSRPEELPIYVTIDVIKDPNEYPDDGDAQVEKAIVARESGINIGRDAVSRRIGKWAFDVAGVLDTPTVRIGLAPGPTSEATITVSKRQVATFSESRITVNATDGEP